ncbi:MAG TPA: hypothetical protein VFN56_02555 [Candidatus Saccharimonadales bacterium]|nr:hypothetical protein [Candidatus Saccharimonadales bacterium]
MAPTESPINPYEQLQDVMAPMVAEHTGGSQPDKSAEELADSYLLAKADGNETQHEAHADVEPYADEYGQQLIAKNIAIAKGTARNNISEAKQHIALLQKRLESGALTKKLEDETRAQISELKSSIDAQKAARNQQVRTLKQTQREEADRLHTVVRTAAEHRIKKNEELSDVYDFWNFNDDTARSVGAATPELPAQAEVEEQPNHDAVAPDTEVVTPVEPVDEASDNADVIINDNDGEQASGEHAEDNETPEQNHTFHFDIGRAEWSERGLEESSIRVLSNKEAALFAVTAALGDGKDGKLADIINTEIDAYFTGLEEPVTSATVEGHIREALLGASKRVDTELDDDSKDAAFSIVKAFVDSDGTQKLAFYNTPEKQTKIYMRDPSGNFISLGSQFGIRDFPENSRVLIAANTVNGTVVSRAMESPEPQRVADIVLEKSNEQLGKEQDKAVLAIDNEAVAADEPKPDQPDKRDQDVDTILPAPVDEADDKNDRDPLADVTYNAEEDGSLVGKEWVDEHGYLNRVQSVDKEGRVAVQRLQRMDGRRMDAKEGDRYGRKLRRQLTYGADINDVFRDITAWNNGGENAKLGTRAHANLYDEKVIAKYTKKTDTVPTDDEEKASPDANARARRLGKRVIETVKNGQLKVRETSRKVRNNRLETREDEQADQDSKSSVTRRARRLGSVATSRTIELINRKRRQTQASESENEDDDEVVEPVIAYRRRSAPKPQNEDDDTQSTPTNV